MYHAQPYALNNFLILNETWPIFPCLCTCCSVHRRAISSMFFYALLTWQRWASIPWRLPNIIIIVWFSQDFFFFLNHLCTDDEVKRNVNSLTRCYVFRGVLHELFMLFGDFNSFFSRQLNHKLFYDKWEKIKNHFLSRQSSHNHCLAFFETLNILFGVLDQAQSDLVPNLKFLR